MAAPITTEAQFAIAIGTAKAAASVVPVMSKDSRVGGEIPVRGYARSLSPAHSQKITRGHNI